MEEHLFPRPAVAEVLERRYVEARLHTDGQRNLQKILELQDELAASAATPFYVIVDPKDARDARELREHAGPFMSGGTPDEEGILEFLGTDRVSSR